MAKAFANGDEYANGRDASSWNEPDSEWVKGRQWAPDERQPATGWPSAKASEEEPESENEEEPGQLTERD